MGPAWRWHSARDRLVSHCGEGERRWLSYWAARWADLALGRSKGEKGGREMRAAGERLGQAQDRAK